MLLKDTAVESLTLAVELFNRPVATARDHAVLILIAHAFEMLLKAAIYQDRRSIRQPGSDYTHSLEKCVNIALSDLGLLSDDDVPILMALKQDRDAAAHDNIAMSDDLLWIHVRAAVTVFDRLLRDAFDQRLADVLPNRVLPVSASPPTDVGLVIDHEVEHLRRLLAPGRRMTAEARGRLRPLLALDGAASGRQEAPTEHEVTRAETAMREGRGWRTVFPGLAGLELASDPGGDAQQVVLRIGRDPDGVPVRVASGDETDEALVYRDVNVFDKYGIALSSFGERLELSRQQGYAVIYALRLKDDPHCYYVRRTARGGITFQGLSRRALERAREALSDGLDLDVAVSDYRASLRRS